MYQSKNPIVHEDSWFGQPKYSTPSKHHPTLCRFLLLYILHYIKLRTVELTCAPKHALPHHVSRGTRRQIQSVTVGVFLDPIRCVFKAWYWPPTLTLCLLVPRDSVYRMRSLAVCVTHLPKVRVTLQVVENLSVIQGTAEF